MAGLKGGIVFPVGGSGGAGGGITNINISAGTASNNLSNVVFSNSNNVSFGLNGSTVTATAGAAQGSINLSAGTTNNLSSAFTFSNSNNVSFGLNAGVFTATATVAAQSAIKALGASNTGNTAGNTGVSTGIDWVIAGSQAVTISESTVGGGPNTLWINAPNAAAGNVSFSAGTSSAGLASLVFSDSNLLSFGLDGNTITANKALNMSFGANSNTFSSQIVFSNSNGVSFGLNGSTVTASVAALSTIENWQNPASVFLSQNIGVNWGVGTVAILHSSAPYYITASAAQAMLTISQSTSSNSSYSIGLTVRIGLYTRNVSTLSLASSGSQTYAWSITSNNSTSLMSGWRIITVPINLNVTPGDYWVGYMSSTASTNANWATVNNAVLGSLNSNLAGPLNAAGNASNQYVLGQGFFTSFSSNMPVSMAFSHISGGQLGGVSSRFQGPILNFYNFSA